MKTQERTSEKILKILVKEPFIEHTITALSKSLNKTRQGVWKIVSQLSKDNLVYLKSIADTKKSAVKIELKFTNSLTSKTISLILTKESLDYEKWAWEFSEFEKSSDFIILFGSILTNPKDANDIDILIITDKKNFKVIDEIKSRLQKTQDKKIHLVDLTREEFKMELKKQNEAYLDALKKGIILFGQDDYVKFIEELK